MFTREKIVLPNPYLVLVEVGEYPNCGFKGTFTARVGSAKTVTEAKALIIKDKRAMVDTFGGLIEKVGLKNRTYRVFRSSGWAEIGV